MWREERPLGRARYPEPVPLANHPGDPAPVPVIRHARLREMDPCTVYRLAQLREAVFSQEQRATDADLDGRELEETTVLVWIEEAASASAEPGVPLAHARVLTEPEAMRIGRVLVRADARRGGHGRRVMEEALDICHRLHPDRDVHVDAQAYLEDWYASMGFVRVGEPFMEAGILHVGMIRAARLVGAPVSSLGAGPAEP